MLYTEGANIVSLHNSFWIKKMLSSKLWHLNHSLKTFLKISMNSRSQKKEIIEEIWNLNSQSLNTTQQNNSDNGLKPVLMLIRRSFMLISCAIMFFGCESVPHECKITQRWCTATAALHTSNISSFNATISFAHFKECSDNLVSMARKCKAKQIKWLLSFTVTTENSEQENNK